MFQRSEEFDNAFWAKQQSSVTANAITSPAGTITADKLVEDSSNNIHTAYAFLTGLVAAQTYSFSIYAKAAERTSFALDFRATGNGFRSVFDLAARTATGSAIGTGTLVSTSITALPNGWYRCVVTGSHPTDTSINITARLNNPAGTDSYTGDGTSGIYLWGAQLEAGAFPTSYIPTTSGTAPRNADVASITGTNFSGWYNQSEGTVFAEAAKLFNGADFNRKWSLNDGSAANVLAVYSNTNRYEVARNILNGGVSNIVGATVGSLTASVKTCVGNNASGTQYATNGQLSSLASASAVPVVNQIRIGSEWYGAQLNGTIKRLTYWQTRLPNAVLQQITL